MTKSLTVFSVITLLILLSSGTIDLDNLFSYANQDIPSYVDLDTQDNVPDDNPMNDAIATLGRVLFYDTHLSTDNTISCASCHVQEFAFGDTAAVSVGVNGVTGRHAMRLVNPRFTINLDDPVIDIGFFWDERAGSLEELATQPIQDHIEMGYSGEDGDPSMEDLIFELEAIDYYQTLFPFAFGDPTISEERIGQAIANFVRSIQSFDSQYDIGRAMVNDHHDDFPNYTTEENLGKALFFDDIIYQNGDENSIRVGGGLACGLFCHQENSFSIDAEHRNNGNIFEIDGTEVLDISKAPSLRDVFNPDGTLNGPLFHDARPTFDDVLDHYNSEVVVNSNIGTTLAPGGLNITAEERAQITAFMKTLTGSDIYTNVKWSNPFAPDGEITFGTVGIPDLNEVIDVRVYPNPTRGLVNLDLEGSDFSIKLSDSSGKIVMTELLGNDKTIDLSGLARGSYYLLVSSKDSELRFSQKIIKD